MQRQYGGTTIRLTQRLYTVGAFYSAEMLFYLQSVVDWERSEVPRSLRNVLSHLASGLDRAGQSVGWSREAVHTECLALIARGRRFREWEDRRPPTDYFTTEESR